jgi:hypothetical protein
MMPSEWLICTFCLASADGCADMTAAKCWVHDARGVEIPSTQPLHQSKRWSHYRLDHDLFLEFRYDSIEASIGTPELTILCQELNRARMGQDQTRRAC